MQNRKECVWLIQSGVFCIVVTIDNNKEHEIVTDCY